MRGDVYTNTVESAFSLLKRGVYGNVPQCQHAICIGTAQNLIFAGTREKWTTERGPYGQQSQRKESAWYIASQLQGRPHE